ncbi:MAG: hypothetical protein ACRERD_17725, partial [Candidatus Binatia bacterium]
MRQVQVEIGATLQKIVGEFHASALAKAEKTDSCLYDDLTHLALTLNTFAHTEGLPSDVVLPAAAELARPTFCAGWLF